MRNRAHAKMTLLSWCYVAKRKRFGHSEMLIWLRDGTIRGGD